jgi:rubrerythrin
MSETIHCAIFDRKERQNMANTLDNLKEAFAGESQANRKYLAFAKKAEEEGYPQAARLFRAAAEAETVHALAHLAAMKGIGSTKENLQAAISGETFEFTNMYPGMIEQAKKEGNQDAAVSFDNANRVEAVHADLYKKVLQELEKGGKIVYYVCQVCGNTVEGSAPDTCPVCRSPKKMFTLID